MDYFTYMYMYVHVHGNSSEKINTVQDSVKQDCDEDVYL